jgi:methylated-DNA-[protein]-cysteine S-methyltransferase
MAVSKAHSEMISTTCYYSTLAAPTGAFSIAVDGDGAVVATAFGTAAALKGRLPSGTSLSMDRRRTADAVRQASDYFRGKLRVFDLDLAPEGTAFRLRVWQCLEKIPYGQTRSYGDLAESLRSAARPVGGALGANPICVFVPCHRVIGADGSLTGFAFGGRIKRWLLDLESKR